jgi:6-phosphofructokinase 2
MSTIATVTMNPTVDLSYEVKKVIPIRKIRGVGERLDPGGGGINVARVFTRLGGKAVCYYVSGGAAGMTLDGLLGALPFSCFPMRTAGNSRIAVNIFELETGLEYRFLPPGPTVVEHEAVAALHKLEEIEADYIVASGSLPPGMPADFYAEITRIADRKGIKMVLDTSGAPLREGLAGAPVYFVKPNLREFNELVGRDLANKEEVIAAAREYVASGRTEIIVVTMDVDGAVLVTADDEVFHPAIEVPAKSAIGAGDSFLAGMIWRLSQGDSPREAFRYGMAAGSAAMLTAGTNLAQPDDIERLLAETAPA